jgi:AAA15 family ATPase/GTPase
MFILFKINNFRSIVNTTVDLNYGEGKAPNRYKEAPSIAFLEEGKHRLVPCLALYGANAGGKTNVIRAFFVFLNLIKHGIEAGYDPNKLVSEQRHTCFEAEIILDSKVYLYYIEYSNNGIISELLKKDKETIFQIKNSEAIEFKPILSEVYKETHIKEILRVECSNEKGTQERSFLNLIGTKYTGLNKDITRVLNFFISSVFVSSTNGAPIALGSNPIKAYFDNEKDAKIRFDKLQKIITKLDFGIQRLEIDREMLDKHNEYALSIKEILENTARYRHVKETNLLKYLYSYRTDALGNEVQFNFQDESMGTQIAFNILGSILTLLEKGGVLLVDELDRSLHSLIFQQIVKLFKDKRYNTKNAQLIFTAHNTDLLDSDILRVSEIGFINKTLKKGTTIQRLVEFANIRNISNFRKRYLQGEFNAIPFPYL